MFPYGVLLHMRRYNTGHRPGNFRLSEHAHATDHSSLPAPASVLLPRSPETMCKMPQDCPRPEHCDRAPRALCYWPDCNPQTLPCGAVHKCRVWSRLTAVPCGNTVPGTGSWIPGSQLSRQLGRKLSVQLANHRTVDGLILLHSRKTVPTDAAIARTDGTSIVLELPQRVQNRGRMTVTYAEYRLSCLPMSDSALFLVKLQLVN